MKFIHVCFVITVFGVHVSYALNIPCTTTEDCPAQEKSVCSKNNTCQCDELSKYSEGLEKCLTYATKYDTLCYEDWQCEDFIGENSQCLNNACLCKTEYRWYQGKCQKYAKQGEACGEDVICFDGTSPLSLNCTDNICQCSAGYYDRQGDCRVESKEEYPCAITSDCFPSKDQFGMWKDSHCELGKCIRNDATGKAKKKEFNNTFRYSEPASYLKTFMKEDVVTSSTGAPEEKCPNGVSSDLPENDCLECPNTLYFKEAACICDRGFFLQGGKCIAELGMVEPNTGYQNDSDCPIRPGKAVDGVCYCRDYWFQSSTNRECKKTTLQFTDNCLDNDWCRAMGPYAYCDSQEGKCQCISKAVLNETSFYCELDSDADISKICLEKSSCLLYETCIDEKCQCDTGFYRINDTSVCLPQIGYSCEVRDCSHIENAICNATETCQCQSEDFVTNGSVCLKTATKLNEECEIKEQCKNIPNADCRNVSASENVTSQCLCMDEYLNIEGICYAVKSPGSQCATQLDCTVILGDTFECRNSLCQCPIGKTVNDEAVCVLTSAGRVIRLSVLPVFLAALVILRFKLGKLLI